MPCHTFQDAVDCPEWIVPFHVFKSLAEAVQIYFPAEDCNYIFYLFSIASTVNEFRCHV